MEGYSHLGSMIVIDEKVNHELLDRLSQYFTDSFK